MKVTYTLDDNYIFPFIISAYSLHRNISSKCIIEVIKVSSFNGKIGLSEQGELICRDLCEKLGIQLVIRDIKNETLDLKFLNFPAWDRFTQTTWLRYFALFSHSYDPGGIMRYTEPDTLFLPHSRDFFKREPLKGYILARRTGGHEQVTALWKIEGKPTNGYFNCGVMIVALDKWRRRHTVEQFQHCIDTAQRMNFKVIEQDALNLMIEGTQEDLPISLNTFPDEFNPLSTGIIHFAGGLKPWLFLHNFTRWRLSKNAKAAMKEWDALESEVNSKLKHKYPESYRKTKKLKKSLRPRKSKVIFDNFPNLAKSKAVINLLRIKEIIKAG